MNILDKIDRYMNEKAIVSKFAIHEAKVGDKEYDDFFKEMLKKYKIKSYKDLPKDKQAKFFDDVDKSWKSQVEKGKTSKKYRKGQSSIGD